MRTFVRILLNLVLIVAALVVDGWIDTLKAYQDASHDAKIAMLVTPVIVAFIVACLILAAVPSRAQLARRNQAKKPAYSYTGTGRGRRR